MFADSINCAGDTSDRLVLLCSDFEQVVDATDFVVSLRSDADLKRRFNDLFETIGHRTVADPRNSGFEALRKKVKEFSYRFWIPADDDSI